MLSLSNNFLTQTLTMEKKISYYEKNKSRILTKQKEYYRKNKSINKQRKSENDTFPYFCIIKKDTILFSEW